MFAITPTQFLIISIIAFFLLVYAAYVIIARKRCNQANILKATACVTGVSGIITALSVYLPEYTPGMCDIIAAIMLTYHFGRTILKIERGPAIRAALMFFGLTLLCCIIVAVAIVFLLH